VAAAVAFAAVEGSAKVGDITADFRRELQPRTPTQNDPSTTEEARGAESTLGNFVADVQLWAARERFADTQIALMNPGGLRADLVHESAGDADPDGNVTYAEAAAVQPFANTLVTMTLTGAQLASVLEEQWQPAGASRPFLKLGVSKGLTYVTDYEAPAGSRITNLALNGTPIDPATSYRVVVNSFLASGGDNFGTLALGTDRADSGLVDLQAMVDWFAANGQASPDLAQRSIGVQLSAPVDERGYQTGSAIDVTLSSLDFTQTATPAGTVTVSIAGQEVGSAPVDRSPVALTDQSGQASLTVTVPQGLSGEVLLGITTPTGTSFAVPITVFDLADSAVFGFPNKLFAKAGSAVQFTTVVVAEGGVPVTGDVTIFDGDAAIATATLTEEDRGVVKVKLPRLDKGVHKLSAAYAGSDTVKPSESPAVPVFVW
jgi:5'-nucleotidase